SPRTSIHNVLPFWRATSTMTVRNLKSYVSDSGSSSKACINNHFCHGLNLRPKTSSANSITSNPNEVSGVNGLNGAGYSRGTVLPLSAAATTVSNTCQLVTLGARRAGGWCLPGHLCLGRASLCVLLFEFGLTLGG